MRQWMHGGRLALVMMVLLSVNVHADELYNAVVAIVNDEVITQQDLETVLFAEQPKHQQLVSLSEAERVKHGLRQLIEERLILQAARTAQIEVDTSLTNARLEQVRSQYETEGEFDQSLAAAGLTRAMLRRRYRDQYLMQRVMDQEVRARIVITPSEIARYYEEHQAQMAGAHRVHVYHMLVRADDTRDMHDALRRARDAVKRVQRGQPFRAVARALSDGPEAENGGDMGWVDQGQLRPELNDVLFRLGVHEVSEPIASSLGYHVVMVTERQTGATWSLDEVEESIQEAIFREKFEGELARWLADLQQKSYIVIKLPHGA